MPQFMSMRQYIKFHKPKIIYMKRKVKGAIHQFNLDDCLDGKKVEKKKSMIRLQSQLGLEIDGDFECGNLNVVIDVFIV